MKDNTYSFGIVGAGNIAQLHAQAIGKCERARIAGVTAIPLNAAERFAKEHGLRAYANFEALLSEPEIDVITLCTPSGLHAQQAIAAMKAGKHVIVEKPIAITLKDADEIIETSVETCRKVGVISQLRFDPSIAVLRAAIDNGVFGRIVFINGRVHFYREASYFSSSDWRGTRAMDGGGALMNQGIHAVDLVRWFGGPVKSIYCNARTLEHNIEVEDTLVASLEFTSGALGTFEATTCSYPGLNVRIEVHGTKGTAIIEDSDIVYWQTVTGDQCPVVSAENGVGSGASNPMAISCSGHIAQFKDFITAIDNDGAPIIDAKEGRKALELVLSAYASSELGERICI